MQSHNFKTDLSLIVRIIVREGWLSLCNMCKVRLNHLLVLACWPGSILPQFALLWLWKLLGVRGHPGCWFHPLVAVTNCSSIHHPCDASFPHYRGPVSQCPTPSRSSPPPQSVAPFLVISCFPKISNMWNVGADRRTELSEAISCHWCRYRQLILLLTVISWELEIQYQLTGVGCKI